MDDNRGYEAERTGRRSSAYDGQALGDLAEKFDLGGQLSSGMIQLGNLERCSIQDDRVVLQQPQFGES